MRKRPLGLLVMLTIFVASSFTLEQPKYSYAFKLFDEEIEVRHKNIYFEVFFDRVPLKYKHYSCLDSKGVHRCYYSWILYSYDKDFYQQNKPITIIRTKKEKKDTMEVFIGFSTEPYKYGYTHADRTTDSILFIPDQFLITEPTGMVYWKSLEEHDSSSTAGSSR